MLRFRGKNEFVVLFQELDDKKNMLASLKKLHDMAVYQQKVTSLEDKIKEAQEDLEALRVKQRLLSLTEGPQEDLR